MTVLAACTIVCKRELAAARVLTESFRRYHPGGRVFVLLVDRVDGYLAPEREPFELIELAALGLGVPERLCFAYCLPELRAVFQPLLLAHLLSRRAVEKLLYLDRRLVVLGGLGEAARLLDRHPVLVVPRSRPKPSRSSAEARTRRRFSGRGSTV